MKKPFIPFLVTVLLFTACQQEVAEEETVPLLEISDNERYFVTENGEPFFWLGDTGWLLFRKLDREEAVRYLDDRQSKGFNVIQASVIHSVGNPTNAYGDSAIVNLSLARPVTTPGSSFEDSAQYDYWDHVDYIIDLAEERGIYMGLIPTWGSNIKGGFVSHEEATAYAQWLVDRFKDRPNIIWLNGGDVKGSDSLRIWNAVGEIYANEDPNHLVTFHPFGRTMSSEWFQDEAWLDFHMFQSGHRRYDQDDTERAYGEDNWRYVREVYDMDPVRPVVDGEPSYEGIPEGLHDTTQPYWDDDDLRRYAYWAVFAGAAGFTYGNNAIMQFHKPTDQGSAYGAKKYWFEALHDSGAYQMVHLKNLMLTYPYLERVPDQELIASGQGERYDYLIATRGGNYALVYTHTGRNMIISMGRISGDQVEASWFNPRNGQFQSIGTVDNTDTMEFDPPGKPRPGNDWVLVLSDPNVN